MRTYHAAILVLGAAIACKGSSSFDPGAVLLAGQWTLTVDDHPDPVTSPGIVNPCEIRNVPVHFTTDDNLPGGFLIQTGAGGGTIRCQTSGVWGAAAPYLQGATLTLTRIGADSVEFSLGSGPALRGRLVAEGLMIGSTNPTHWSGRVGIWSLFR